MAVPDLDTPEGLATAIKALDPDFQGLLERKDVPARLQGTLSNNGVKSISRFAVLGETAADMRRFATDHCGLAAVRDVVQIAGVIDAWEASRTRMQARHKAEAEASMASLPAPVNKTEAQDLKVRFEQAHYKLEDKVWPATGTLELLFEQVEAGEWRHMSLVQFMSKDDQDQEPLGATIDKSGTVKIKKGFGEAQPPKSPEDLRQKIKLLGHSYIFVQLKYPNRAVLRDVTPNLFMKLADYLLGAHIFGLKAKDSQGETVSSPSFDLVLSYEYQLRKAMTKAMNEGAPMVRALEDAMKDTTVKERYFLTPAALGAASSHGHQPGIRMKSRSPRRDGSGDARGSSWGYRPKGKGKGKKGKGKKAGGRTIHSHTPDGRAICYSWNNKDQRCRWNCGRVHCCQICFGSHPMHACKEQEGKPAGKDTAGDAAGKA